MQHKEILLTFFLYKIIFLFYSLSAIFYIFYYICEAFEHFNILQWIKYESYLNVLMSNLLCSNLYDDYIDYYQGRYYLSHVGCAVLC